MLIEVLKNTETANKSQGDVLEKFAEEWLKIKGYKVERNIRLTGTELDLLCKEDVSSRKVYVECKANNTSTLSAVVLRQMLGTIEYHHYSEGWLLCTGQLGKDAKGFMEDWEKRPDSERSKLSIYTPERIINGLIGAKLIIPPPESLLQAQLSPDFSIGDWILILCEYGKYWGTTILKNGIPQFFVLFSSSTGNVIDDDALLAKIKETDLSLKKFNYWIDDDLKKNEDSIFLEPNSIVEVEFGEKWSDYRPAKPEHFVGRKSNIREIFHFISEVKRRKTDTRVFAIKGDSGIGKSSLIAKLRDDAKTSKKPSNIFLFAVDVRAASNSSYITAAFLQALKAAQIKGFGSNVTLEITNNNNPLASQSIKGFLDECNRKNQIIIFVLDQFEELYSKSDLYEVFEEAQTLMFSVISAASNIIMGFAWKTDCSVPQDHPAYYMWHNLSDHRFEIALKQFSHSDAEQSLIMFESELGVKIRHELRKYLQEHSQGYPWLLKKLCIHFCEQLNQGASQLELESSTLDIASLFEQDLNNLSKPEMSCIRQVAKNAPMDWYEVIETSGQNVVQALQDKRLLIRRGDKLNLYWDIFKDYVLNRTIPDIPFNYIPQSASLDGLLRVAMQLDNVETKSMKELAETTDFKETTIRNILHDLTQFGIIRNNNLEKIVLDDTIDAIDEKSLLLRLRVLFKRHQLTNILSNRTPNEPVDPPQIVSLLKRINPTAQHHTKTWNIYANRMRLWLMRLGYLKILEDKVVFHDSGDIDNTSGSFARNKTGGLVFIADASPAAAYNAFMYIAKNGAQPVVHMKNKKYRNACSVLIRLRMISLSRAYMYEQEFKSNDTLEVLQEIRNRALAEKSIKLTIDVLKKRPNASGALIGDIINNEYERQWLPASKKRIGGGLRNWVIWLLKPVQEGVIPLPRGIKEEDISNKQLTFDF